VRSIQPIGSRVQKYQHLLAEIGEFTRAELAVLCTLALRGPQTQAEVRSRAARLMPDGDATELEPALEALAAREPEPVVMRLERQPGQKEPRYAHRLGGSVTPEQPGPSATPTVTSTDRMAALEALVHELQEEVADLRSELGSFRRQFE
jgi:uncharacterized protein YceH (UPF0502 family)